MSKSIGTPPECYDCPMCLQCQGTGAEFDSFGKRSDCVECSGKGWDEEIIDVMRTKAVRVRRLRSFWDYLINDADSETDMLERVTEQFEKRFPEIVS